MIDPSIGEARIGVGGTALEVVKLDVDEYELVPPAFVAFTRQ